MQFVCVHSENTLANKGLSTFISILSRRDITFILLFYINNVLTQYQQGVTSPTTVQEHETLFCLGENDTRGNAKKRSLHLLHLKPQKV